MSSEVASLEAEIKEYKLQVSMLTHPVRHQWLIPSS